MLKDGREHLAPLGVPALKVVGLVGAACFELFGLKLGAATAGKVVADDEDATFVLERVFASAEKLNVLYFQTLDPLEDFVTPNVL